MHGIPGSPPLNPSGVEGSEEATHSEWAGVIVIVNCWQKTLEALVDASGSQVVSGDLRFRKGPGGPTAAYSWTCIPVE